MLANTNPKTAAEDPEVVSGAFLRFLRASKSIVHCCVCVGSMGPEAAKEGTQVDSRIFQFRIPAPPARRSVYEDRAFRKGGRSCRSQHVV